MRKKKTIPFKHLKIWQTSDTRFTTIDRNLSFLQASTYHGVVTKSKYLCHSCCTEFFPPDVAVILYNSNLDISSEYTVRITSDFVHLIITYLDMSIIPTFSNPYMSHRESLDICMHEFIEMLWNLGVISIKNISVTLDTQFPDKSLVTICALNTLISTSPTLPSTHKIGHQHHQDQAG